MKIVVPLQESGETVGTDGKVVSLQQYVVVIY